MNTRKIIFAFAATFTLLAASCTPNTTADDDKLYTNSIDKSEARIDPRRGE